MKPTWFDWLTVSAIFLGPVFALFAQRALDWLRERKQRRIKTYLTVMSLRGSWLHPDSLNALNLIDTVFDRRGDQKLREAWTAIIRHVGTDRPDWDTAREQAQAWDSRLVDLRMDLYQLMGSAVGYNHTLDYIKTQFYYPQLYMNAELDNLNIRTQFAKVITERGLKVIVTN